MFIDYMLACFYRKNDKQVTKSDAVLLKRGTMLKIPPLEQYVYVRCGGKSEDGGYQHVHIRLTGKLCCFAFCFNLLDLFRSLENIL